MPVVAQAALLTALWCVLHSAFVTHRWRALVRRRAPGYRPWERLVYVLASTASFAALAWWLLQLPSRELWAWPGAWQAVRWGGLAAAAALFVGGARGYDGRTFLGLRRLADARAGRPDGAADLRTDGILGRVRHPWYAGTLLVLVCAAPFTDVDLAARAVLFVYVLVGTELEERKLLVEFGDRYAAYRRRVPRYLPRPGRRTFPRRDGPQR